MSKFKILFLGDIVGKNGRRAVSSVLPKWKKKYKMNFVIANGENLAHGFGLTEKTIDEMVLAGVNFFTSGNHCFKKVDFEKLTRERDNIIRPANYPEGNIGAGYKILTVDGYKLLIINLIGRVFFRESFDCPFRQLDNILAKTASEKIDFSIIDFHAEATAEKKTLAFYADGRVSALVGSHTHVQTSDARILPKGTAYLTDVGFCGTRDSIIGFQIETIVKQYLSQSAFSKEVEENGISEVNAVLIEFEGKTKQVIKIDLLQENVNVLDQE